jgi:short-chain Z-isoprenyl diphosphate synthase
MAHGLIERQVNQQVSRRSATERFSAATSQNGLIKHLAVILDGNRRWAAEHHLRTIDGYRAGGDNVHAFLGWCEEAGIPLVTLWPLSAENLRRDPDELQGLLTVIVNVIDELAHSGHWHLHLLGDLDKLPLSIAQHIREAEQSTAHVHGVEVNIAVAYSGRLELLRAVQSLLAEYMTAGTLDQLAGTLNAELIANRLYTAGQPDPDLVIRTSGEQRLSNFMPWQSAFSEFYFTPVCWPDFSHADFDDALAAYRVRQRRFGG